MNNKRIYAILLELDIHDGMCVPSHLGMPLLRLDIVSAKWVSSAFRGTYILVTKMLMRLRVVLLSRSFPGGSLGFVARLKQHNC